MKNVAFVLVISGVILATALGIWLSHSGHSKVAVATPSPATGVKPPTSAPTFSSSIKPGDWQELHHDRDTTLNSNPELAAEYKSLLTDLDNQQKDLESAMIKADPKMAPLVAKLEAMRKHVAPSTSGSTSSKPQPNTLTQDELAQLRTARMAALKANPDFDTKAKQLALKLRDFQQKLAAAMVQSDPNLAPVLAKMGGSPQPPKTNSPSKTD